MASFRTIAITAATVVCYCLLVSFGPAFFFGSASAGGDVEPSIQAYVAPRLD